MVKKHYNRYIYATYERIFEAGTKETFKPTKENSIMEENLC